MLRSKDIKDYFPIHFTDLRPGIELTLDIHLFFEKNRHILLWLKEGQILYEDFYEKYCTRGVKTVWVHNADRDKYLRYQRRKDDCKTNAGAFASEVLNSESASEHAKEALVSEVAKEVLRESFDEHTEESQKEADEKAKEVVSDVLNVATNKSHDLLSEIWNMTEIDPQLEHSVNVASYAVLFAMAFGRIDQELLSDIAIAALTHDLGLSQVSANLTQKPLASMSDSEKIEYGKHVHAAVDLINQTGQAVSSRSIHILTQHHEKFDGSGYPSGLREYDFDDIAQLLSLADLLDMVSKGGWDGSTRNLRNAYELIESIESGQPEFFSPELFSLVINWIRNESSEDAITEAVQMVENQSEKLMGKKAS